MANKRIRDLDDGAANLTTTDSLPVDRTAIDEAERVTVQNIIDKPTDVSAAGWVLDEDTLATDSATQVPTQQSVKAYVDTNTIGNVVEDTTPQLGGSLDVNGQEITGAIDLHSTGDIIAELGDAAGTNKLSIRDSAGTEQAAIDSDGNITTNGTVDGIDIATDVAANTAKVTNATHTGDVTGATALTVDPTAISGKSLVTAVTGDQVLLLDATDGALKKADVSDFGGGGGLNNVVEDTTPQLGGQLDVNGNAIGDGTLELVTFVEDASAVNHLEVENEATGSGPILRATGDDTNVDLNLEAKGSGSLLFETNTVWHAGNDGTGSGLDADTVDGVEAASLLQNVVEDTTPQLGGPLDVNSQEITGAIDLHSTGDIIAELGDAAGTNKLSVRDSGAVEVAAVDSDGNITTSGTVDGRDVATDGTKLDGIATSATANPNAIDNVVEDTTPQLGGQLDVNGNAIGDGTLELLTFTETASAVNHVNLTNAATGTAPKVEAAGDDTNVDLIIDGKGTGLVKISDAYTLPSADGTANQVLQTDGAGALSFAAAGGGASASGQPISLITNATWGVPGTGVSGNSNRTHLVDYLVYEPFYVAAAITVSEVIMEVQTASGSAGSTARIGICTSDTDFQPLALTSDLGTIATDSTGQKTITALSVSLSEGWYFKLAVIDGANTIFRCWECPSPVFGNQFVGYGASQLRRAASSAEHTAFSSPPPDWSNLVAGFGTKFIHGIGLKWTVD